MCFTCFTEFNKLLQCELTLVIFFFFHGKHIHNRIKRTKHSLFWCSLASKNIRKLFSSFSSGVCVYKRAMTRVNRLFFSSFFLLPSKIFWSGIYFAVVFLPLPSFNSDGSMQANLILWAFNQSRTFFSLSFVFIFLLNRIYGIGWGKFLSFPKWSVYNLHSQRKHIE